MKKNNIPIIQTLHDYKLICPNYKLYSNNQICEQCLNNKYYNCFFKKCMHNSWTKSFLAMIEAYLNNKILKYYDLVDLFIAPSQFMKNIYIKFGLKESKIKVIYNFINNLNIIEEKNCKENYILYFGRLSSEKGINILIKAIKKINFNIKLKIVGIGPEYKNLKILIKKLNLQNKIELIGAKYDKDLIKIIKCAKAIIIPSIWYENMPLAAIEAIAINKTVIASNIGGIPEIIKNNINGLLFESENENDLVQKINYYFKNPKLEKIFYKNNKIIFKNNFSNSNVDKIELIYNMLLNKIIR